jgi:hypothetical protein
MGADSDAMNPAHQSSRIFGLSLPRVLPMKRPLWRAAVSRADSSSFQGICVLWILLKNPSFSNSEKIVFPRQKKAL